MIYPNCNPALSPIFATSASISAFSSAAIAEWDRLKVAVGLCAEWVENALSQNGYGSIRNSSYLSWFWTKKQNNSNCCFFIRKKQWSRNICFVQHLQTSNVEKIHGQNPSQNPWPRGACRHQNFTWQSEKPPESMGWAFSHLAKLGKWGSFWRCLSMEMLVYG